MHVYNIQIQLCVKFEAYKTNREVYININTKKYGYKTVTVCIPVLYICEVNSSVSVIFERVNISSL